jgi:hypothetical protein
MPEKERARTCPSGTHRTPEDGEGPPPREKPATSLTGEEICTAERFQSERVRERERQRK